MFLRKTGLPEESSLVMCTVTNIQYSSVFAQIDDYGISGMIHISEIAAGRIRNIRDYVKEGKKIVCKVLRVYPDKGHVDLSLRRVNENQRRNKVNEIKFEQKAESIIEHVAKECKLDNKKLYEDIMNIVSKEYLLLHHAFEDVVAGNLDLKTLGLEPKVSSLLEELVIQRFKPKIIEIAGVLSITIYEPNGLEVIKNALHKAAQTEGIDIKYLGGGKYLLEVKAPEYKEAEAKLKESSEGAIEIVTQSKGVCEFKRK